MIHAGTDLKFRVKTNLDGFTMKNDDFTIIITNRWGQTRYIIYKRDCLVGSDGNYYFTIDSVPSGLLRAKFTAKRIDTDFEDDVQTVVDNQDLVFVGDKDYCDCYGNDSESQDTDGMAVAYKMVWTVCIAGYVFLTEEDGTPILDSEGNKIYFVTRPEDTSAAVPLSMSSREFKDLIEGRNQNGKVDTVPEVMDAMQEVNEGTSFTEMTSSDVDNMMNRILNN